MHLLSGEFKSEGEKGMGKSKGTMMQKIQRFGGAMFTPVLFFAVFGIIVGFATLFKNNLVFGELANPEGVWYKVCLLYTSFPYQVPEGM